MAWAESHILGAPVKQVLSLADRFTTMEQVALLERAAVGRPAVFSTSELLRHERAALALVERGRRAGAPTVPPAGVREGGRSEAAGASRASQRTGPRR